MKITLEEAARIARLAHLRFSEQDLSRMRSQLDQVLEHVGVLATLEPGPGDAAAAATRQNEAPPLRDDVLIAPLSAEEALEAAPESGQGHFMVPRVIP